MSDCSCHRLEPVKLPLVNKFYRSHRSRMRARGDEQLWVCRAGSEIVAALRLREFIQEQGGGLWLTGLYVSPDRRQQGIGSQLIEAATEAVDEPVWLFCHPDLGRFYQRLGFVPAGRLPESLASRLTRYQRTQSLVALEKGP